MRKSSQTLEHDKKDSKSAVGGAKDRVRRNTASQVQEKLDSQTQADVQHHAAQGSEAVSKRIEELDREWSIDRALMVGVGFNVLAGLLLGRTVSRKWYLFPALVAGFLLLHAVQGWCPPLPILRRLGFRTSKEIDQEKYALKAIRGDFRGLGTKTSDPAGQSGKALAASL